MMPSRNLFKCLTILQLNERLKNCLQMSSYPASVKPALRERLESFTYDRVFNTA